MATSDSPALCAGGEAAVTLGRLAGASGQILRPGSWKKAEIRRVRGDGQWLVIKDWRAAPTWLRPVATWMLAREAAIYTALKGVPGVPRLIAAGERILVIEHVSGRVISSFMHGKGKGLHLGRRLEVVVGEMHRRGIYHGDLHYRRNILVTPDGCVHIIDFASAVDCRRLGLTGRVLRPVLAFIDRYALIKWKCGVEAESAGAWERRFLALLDSARFKAKSRRS